MADERGNAESAESEQPTVNARRKIPGNFPYTSAAGVLSTVLEKIPQVEKPSLLNYDFLSTVIGVRGGSARQVIPILKATGILSQSSSPTDLYDEFRLDGGRASAALEALRNGFSELFRRNQFVHKAEEKTVLDLIVSITGLPRNDKIARYIYNTFSVFQKYARSASETEKRTETSHEKILEEPAVETHREARKPQNVGLIYNINIVLPETTNIEVYNAIFKSVRGNLQQ